MDEGCRLHGYTVKSYTGDVAEFLVSIKGKAVDQVKKLHVLSYLSQARERGVSDATRNRKHAAIHCFYKSLIELELVTANPAFGIKKSKTEKNRAPVFLDESGLERFLQSVEGKYRTRNLAIFLLMGYMGLRVGEVHALNCKDYNAERRTLNVFGKGRKWRTLPVPDTVADLLSEALGERLAHGVRRKRRSLYHKRVNDCLFAAFSSSRLKPLNDSSSNPHPRSDRTIPVISCGTHLLR